MSEEQKPKPQTNYLSLPDDAQPMPERQASPGTNLLNTSWHLGLKIGVESVNLDIGEPILVGRVTDSSDADQIGLDLSSYGAYQGGVSRRHAVITFHNGALYIEDLGSTNGTRINGFQLTANRKYRLRDGDEVEFARLRASVRFMRPDK